MAEQRSLCGSCRVFADLWDRGLYVTAGDQFGGRFLVYGDDPARVHSGAIVHVYADGQILTGVQLLALARLATAVNKVMVLASDCASSDVVTQSNSKGSRIRKRTCEQVCEAAEAERTVKYCRFDWCTPFDPRSLSNTKLQDGIEVLCSDGYQSQGSL